MKDFLPISKEDMKKRGWEQVDFTYVIGDAYVDHSSFGPAIISRVLESRGFKVGIIAQPDWKNEESINVFGRPRLGFLVSGGNMDPMVNHYTVSKKRRKTDAYTPGGVIGKRPDHATVVYCNLIKKLYKDYVILIKEKNNNYISFDEDEKIIHYFSIKDVNTIYLNNLEIEEKYEYENNKYNELYLKVKIIEMLEVLCKKELE